MANSAKSERTNQRLRTRKDLLEAAARLLRAGKNPDMDAVAAEAMVSRATAYRYFPSIEALLLEAPLDGLIPTPEEVFPREQSTDPLQRIDQAEAALHAMCHRHESQLRLMLSAAIRHGAGGAARDPIPARQNRRGALIDAALAPARRHFSPAVYRNLCAALSLVFGMEGMIVLKDVLGMDEKLSRKIKSWAVKSLVRAALEQSNAA